MLCLGLRRMLAYRDRQRKRETGLEKRKERERERNEAHTQIKEVKWGKWVLPVFPSSFSRP